MSAKQTLLKHFGTQEALAKAVGVSKQAVSKWFANSGDVPVERCVDIERVTKGKIKRAQLRPDLFGPV